MAMEPTRLGELFLREAIRLARRSVTEFGGGPFGALVVRGEEVLGCGWNQVTTTNDPTAHAEIVAIREAAQTLGDFRLLGCVLYSSCEPCPMCLAAAYWARLEAVWYAADRRSATAVGFDDARLHAELAQPTPRRRLPCRQHLALEGELPFREWLAKPDRTPY